MTADELSWDVCGNDVDLVALAIGLGSHVSEVVDAGVAVLGPGVVAAAVFVVVDGFASTGAASVIIGTDADVDANDACDVDAVAVSEDDYAVAIVVALML